MKSILFIAFFISVYISEAQVVLKGFIKTKTKQEALPGAVIYLPDLKNGTVSKTDGSYEIKNLPKIKTIVQIKLIGYKTFVETIDLSTTTELDVEMEESVIEANEVVVTGVSRATEIKRNPVPMVFIDQHHLTENSSTNIIDAIAKVPGINALATGPNVSKPFIRGLGYNRILTLFDGIRQESQQWGDEHGIEVDQYLIDRIEVVKGPASLIYGSDALAGVVNLIPANPSPDGQISGALQSNYQTNNGSRGGSFNLTGNSSGFIWGMRTSYKEATNYQNKYDGRVYNTGFAERNLNAFLGLNRKWGYSHLNFSMYDNMQEIPDGSRDSSSRKFTKQISEEDTLRPLVSNSELNSYSINAIHQRVQHYRVFSSNNFIIKKSKLALKLGYQQSIRGEYAHPLALDVPALYMNMGTASYDAKFYFPEKKGFESIIGINGMYQMNDVSKGTEFVIPDYKIFDIAPFIYGKKNFGKVDIAAGARYDTRSFKNTALYVITDPITGFDKTTSDTVGATKQFSDYTHTFNGFSGSFGITYNINKKVMVKFNVARGYRAPNISEISAKGVHPGTGFQQLGDENLKPEFSLQEDIGLFYESEHVSASAEVFNNTISNYIFNQKLNSVMGGDSIYMETGNAYPVFKFIQTKAQLLGGEARIDIHPHPLDWLHFSNAVSFVYATNLGGNGAVINDSTKYLPFIPPLHTNSELSAEFLKSVGPFEHIFIKVGLQYYAAQNRAFLFNNTETKTPSYTLLDAGIGAEVKNKRDRTLFTIGIYVSNLTDAAYQSNMSRLKYFDSYPVNGSGRSGIFNMGRNWSFKVNVPFCVKKAS
ncbi:MAG: TonB-dependent receptor [Sphingobacteriaceae bacterium]|nr:TonB-dependent receptor [Sphingobacteriaceae bacterium]